MCAAKLLCFQAVSGFESRRLHHLKKAKNLPQKSANCCQLLLPTLLFFLAFQYESFTLCEERQPMAHYTLIARVNAGNGKFPFVNVQFTKDHRPIPIEGATYYLRPSGGTRTPLNIGRDLAAAHAALRGGVARAPLVRR
jgi:hypothetical protein